MIKPRYFLLIMILNIGLLIAYAINSDYKHIANTVSQFDIKMQSVIDSSVDESMASEELFSDLSSGVMASDTDKYGKLPVYDDTCKRTMMNMYAVAMFYDANKRLPKTASELTFSPDSMTFFRTAYGWAFGDVDTRIPSSEFKRYYDVIGNKIKVDATIPIYPDYNMETHSIAVLDQTGLKLSAYNTEDRYDAETLKNVQKEGYNNTKYYLTPYSLGVTYVNKKLLKVCIMSNIEDAFRLRYGSAVAESEKADAYRKASGCIPSKTKSSGGVEEKHKGSSTISQSYNAVDSIGNSYQTGILNDGTVEIDMNSIDVDVDYSIVDFYDKNKSDLVTFIDGVSGTPAQRKIYPENLAKKNTAGSGDRIVARITVSFNINIPYSNEFSQYYKKKSSTGAVEHLGINGFTYESATKDSTGYVKNGGNVRYEYTTYKALSR